MVGRIIAARKNPAMSAVVRALDPSELEHWLDHLELCFAAKVRPRVACEEPAAAH